MSAFRRTDKLSCSLTKCQSARVICQFAPRNRLTYSDFCTQPHQHPEKVAKKVTLIFFSLARYLIK